MDNKTNTAQAERAENVKRYGFSIGDWVRFKGTGQIKSIEGVVKEFYRGEANCVDEETGERYDENDSASIAVDLSTLTGFWPYTESECFAPDVAQLQRIT